MSRIAAGDLVRWEALNGECSGEVVSRDGMELGYMVVRLRNGRRMLVHESSAEKITSVDSIRQTL